MQRLLIAFGLIVASVSTVNAGSLDAERSYLDIRLGSISKLRLSAQSTDVALMPGTGTHIIEESAVFQTHNFSVNSSVFTGLPALTGFWMTVDAEGGEYTESATYSNPLGPGVVSGVGGVGPFTGSAVLQVLGFDVGPDMAIMGVGGTQLAPVLQNELIVTGAPFNTGTVIITDVETPAVFAPALGVTGVAFTLDLSTYQQLTAIPLTVGSNVIQSNTVTIAGSNDLTASGMGALKLIAPFRVRTEGLKRPGALTKTFTFVPEPTTALQLLTAAGLLGYLGRRNSK